MKYPIANYPLPELEEFIQDPIAFKHFSLYLESEHAKENLDCYVAIVEYDKNPTAVSALSLWETYIDHKASRCVNVTGQIHRDLKPKITQLEKEDKKSLHPKIFEPVQTALLSLMKFNHWITFKLRSEFFEPYLIEAKGTTISKIKKEWWEQNKKTKWGNVGLPCTNHIFKDYIEETGNTIKRKQDIKNVDPESLEGTKVKVYWPADNLTRACLLLKWNKKHQFFTALYYFDEREYEEDLMTDWRVFKIAVVCTTCNVTTGPTKCCSKCGTKAGSIERG